MYTIINRKQTFNYTATNEKRWITSSWLKRQLYIMGGGNLWTRTYTSTQYKDNNYKYERTDSFWQLVQSQ